MDSHPAQPSLQCSRKEEARSGRPHRYKKRTADPIPFTSANKTRNCRTGTPSGHDAEGVATLSTFLPVSICIHAQT